MPKHSKGGFFTSKEEKQLLKKLPPLQDSSCSELALLLHHLLTPELLDQAPKGWWRFWSSLSLKHHRAPCSTQTPWHSVLSHLNLVDEVVMILKKSTLQQHLKS